MKLNKNGSFMVYTHFLIIILINMFIFVVLCNLNTKKLLDEKANYYQILILEERAKRHILSKIELQNIKNSETELIYYENSFVYYVYTIDNINRIYKVNLRIFHNNINEYAYVYYYMDTKLMIYEVR